jgi:nucleotide-binding universal stress UspA family protein
MPIIESSSGLTLDRVMVATDFQKSSEPAFDYGLMLAKRFASRMILAHIVDLSIATQSEQAVVGTPLEQLRSHGAQNMQRVLAQLQEAGVTATGRIIEAHNVAEAIIGLAVQERADLIVLGTTARHGLSRAILGSCAEGVIRHAKCPVLTVGPHAKGPGAAFGNIVFATDLQHDAAEKAAVALTVGEDSNAKIHFCYALENPDDNINRSFEAEIKCEEALRRLVPRGTYEHCQTHCNVEIGDPAPHILEQARKTNADLIVMGARPSPHWFGTLPAGTVSHVLAEAECPVMTVCTS